MKSKTKFQNVRCLFRQSFTNMGFNRKRIMCLLAGVCLLTLVGCTESVIKQFAELEEWDKPTDSPQMISGSPDTDLAAYQASGEMLSDADWQILEQFSPRPIWKQIEEKRNAALRKPQPVPTIESLATTSAFNATKTLERMSRTVTVTEQSDGLLRLVYPMQHHGGVVATSDQTSGTARRKIHVTKTTLAPFVGIVNKQLKERGSCTELPDGRTLMIICQKEAKNEILLLLADIDQPARQVEITARIFEVRHDFDFQYGSKTVLEHIATDNTQALASTFSTQAFLDSMSNPSMGDSAFQGSAMRIFQVFGDSGIAIDATFQALVDTGLIKEVASPRMTVVEGQTGSMIAGQEIPITSAKQATNTIITEKTTYRPVGVQLHVTPQTIGDHQVKMHVLTVVSSVAGFTPRTSLHGNDSLQNIVNPIFNSREAETSVVVPDGSTLVVGGLRMVRQISRERKIPGLGDVMFLEWLFKSHRSQRQMTDLFFYITPTIIPTTEPS